VTPRPAAASGHPDPSGVSGRKPLPREFFARPSLEVGPDLLGCVITHLTADGPVSVMISEVEAYCGEGDPASHAYRGRTARNAVMFGPPGHVYVYFTYGMHFCMNLVCEGQPGPAAVLLRAGRVIEGVPLATARRSARLGRPGRGGRAAPAALREVDLARGPARLCEALAVDRAHDGADATDPASSLLAIAATDPVPAARISRGPRVGISRAADRPWRYWITGDPSVSPYRAYAPRRATQKPVTGRATGDGTIPQ
jgi:DNA-3-methyladenine glycosylase